MANGNAKLGFVLSEGRGSMIFREASPALRQFVNGYFLSELVEGDPIRDRFLPLAPTINFVTPQSAWRLSIGDGPDRAIPAASIFGLASEPFTVSYGPCRSVFVSLTLSGWAAICAGRAGKYVNRVTNVTTLLRWNPSPVLTMMEGDFDGAEIVNVIETQLAPFLRPHDRLGGFAAEVERRIENGQPFSANELAPVTGMTPRNVTRVFHSVFGLTPRVLYRRRRFLMTLWDVIQGEELGKAAERHGYFDSSHLYKDAEEFLGMTVCDYVRRDGPFVGIMKVTPFGARAAWREGTHLVFD